MSSDIITSIPNLIAHDVSKEKIGSVLRDMWQLQMETKFLDIIHHLIIDQNFNFSPYLEQIEEWIGEFHKTWKRYVKAYDIPDTYKRTYKFMEGLFEFNLEDMEALYDQAERLPLYINLQGKYICAFYNYNRSILNANIGLVPREIIITNYRRIRSDFLAKTNQLKAFIGSNINHISPEQLEYIMTLDSLFEETFNDEDDIEIMSYIS